MPPRLQSHPPCIRSIVTVPVPLPLPCTCCTVPLRFAPSRSDEQPATTGRRIRIEAASPVAIVPSLENTEARLRPCAAGLLCARRAAWRAVSPSLQWILRVHRTWTLPALPSYLLPALRALPSSTPMHDYTRLTNRYYIRYLVQNASMCFWLEMTDICAKVEFVPNRSIICSHVRHRRISQPISRSSRRTRSCPRCSIARPTTALHQCRHSWIQNVTAGTYGRKVTWNAITSCR